MNPCSRAGDLGIDALVQFVERRAARLDAVLGHRRPPPRTWINLRDPPKTINSPAGDAMSVAVRHGTAKCHPPALLASPIFSTKFPCKNYQAAPSNARHPSRHCKERKGHGNKCQANSLLVARHAPWSVLRLFLELSGTLSSSSKIPITAFIFPELLASYHCPFRTLKLLCEETRGPRTATEGCQ